MVSVVAVPPAVRVETTYPSASPAEVTQDFWAFRTTFPPSSVAWLAGAQKWLREPCSLHASVLRCLPATILGKYSLPV